MSTVLPHPFYDAYQGPHVLDPQEVAERGLHTSHFWVVNDDGDCMSYEHVYPFCQRCSAMSGMCFYESDTRHREQEAIEPCPVPTDAGAHK